MIQRYSTLAAKSIEPEGKSQLGRLQEQMLEALHYLVNKLIPESKSRPEKLKSLRDLRDSLETSLLSLREVKEVL